MRAERLQPLDDRAQIVRLDRPLDDVGRAQRSSLARHRLVKRTRAAPLTPRKRAAISLALREPTPAPLTGGSMPKLITRRSLPGLVLAAALVVATLAAATASARPTRTGASIKACALLPDTKSSTRYTLFDAPYLTAAFRKAGVPATVLNAHNDPQKQRSQAEQCLAQGAKVILLDQLDPASGASITNLAVSRGAKVIDYDRLVVGSKAAYYVSFDNVKVGKLQGRGLVAALKAKGKYSNHPVIAELNGDIKDNNAKLFKQGYDSILKPLYDKGTFKQATAGDQWTDWNYVKARQEFDQILARNSNKVDGVLAANDGIAGSVVSSLKAHGLKPIPLTGQDATPTGVQFILAGW